MLNCQPRVHHLARHLIYCLLCLLLLITPRPVLMEAKPLTVVYIDGNSLHVWQEGGKDRVLVQGGKLSHPVISPDRSQVVFLNDGELWLVSLVANTKAPSVLVSQKALNPNQPVSTEQSQPSTPNLPQQGEQVLDMGWFGSNTLIFNTLNFKGQPIDQYALMNTLWRVNVANGKLTQLLDNGQGGAFSISPDMKLFAIIQAGEYGKANSGSIQVMDQDGKNVVTLLQFDFVNTAASYKFYPAVQWNDDSSTIYTAIPLPDAVYGKGGATVYKIDVKTGEKQSATVNADFFALPRFSTDGAMMLYARRSGDVKSNHLSLYVAANDGTNEREIANGNVGEIEPGQWIPDAHQFTYVTGQAGKTLLVTDIGKPATPFPVESESVFNLKWADSQTAVYNTSPGGNDLLRYATLNGTPTTIASLTSGGDFDAER